ncbi:hypothetical protein [Streptomyces sp. NPDC058964]|uniref:hypothetical protein n=1 Tax=Streptomyces sp. NPDC058964 TaxID=3346681 RepID=UPI0036A6AC76
MSQSVTPPSQPEPADAAPTAEQAPVAAPYAAQPGAVPPPLPVPPAPGKDNIAVGLLAALGAAVVTAVVYGLVIGLTKHEIGWAAVGVGFVIGLAAGRIGGRNPVLGIVSAVLALGSVYLGQLVGEAMIGAKEVGVSFNEVFFQHFGIVQEAWKADADPLTFVFFAIAAWAAFSAAKKAAA